MTTVYATDHAGNTIRMLELEGRRYTEFEVDNLKHVSKMDARPDDVVIVAYPKAGTHWTFEIVRFLIAGTVDLSRVEKDDYMIEDAQPSFIDSQPSPRNLNTHFHADVISRDFITQKSRFIHVTRDPRDVLVSYYNHHRKLTMYYGYLGEFKDYFPLFLGTDLDYNSWFDYTKSWEKFKDEYPDQPVLTLTYESMKTNPLENIRKISDFLGYNYSEDFLKQIEDKSSFATMKQRNNAGDILGEVMYRKGIIGDWKNWFSVAQSEQFNEYFEREMAGTRSYKMYSHTVQEKGDSNKNV